MTSSCVLTKEQMVMNVPDPCSVYNSGGGGDTDSECGSVCTCTSGSMTSLATSVATSHTHHHRRRSSNLTSSSALMAQPNPSVVLTNPEGNVRTSAVGESTTMAATAAPDANGSPYIVVFVPPSMSSRREGNCSNCSSQGTLQTAFRSYLLSVCEFCPWVAGFVFIYYAFYWWGLGPGFSAFLFMMGSHALVRFFKARGEDGYCGIHKHQRGSVPEEENEQDANNAENEDEDGESPRPPPEVVNESPPSYDKAIIKPPPYDLFSHLTPTQRRSQVNLEALKKEEEYYRACNLLMVPQCALHGTLPAPSDECDENYFLPTYQDAIRLSFKSEKETLQMEAQAIMDHSESRHEKEALQMQIHTMEDATSSYSSISDKEVLKWQAHALETSSSVNSVVDIYADIPFADDSSLSDNDIVIDTNNPDLCVKFSISGDEQSETENVEDNVINKNEIEKS